MQIIQVIHIVQLIRIIQIVQITHTHTSYKSYKSCKSYTSYTSYSSHESYESYESYSSYKSCGIVQLEEGQMYNCVESYNSGTNRVASYKSCGITEGFKFKKVTCYYSLIFTFTKRRMFFVILARFKLMYELSQHLLMKNVYFTPLINICQFCLVLPILHQYLISVLCFLIQLYHLTHYMLYFKLYNIYFAIHKNLVSHKY